MFMGQKRLPSFPFNETQKESDPIHKEAAGKYKGKVVEDCLECKNH